MQLRYRLWLVLLVLALALTWGAGTARAEGGPFVRLVYFYSDECAHCIVVINEVLTPLQAEYGGQLQIKMVEISDPANYEMLIRAEEIFDVSPEERGLPTLVVGGQVLIGEDAIREQLPCLLDTCLGAGGTSWPDIPGLEEVALEGEEGLDMGFDLLGSEGSETCGPEDAVACEAPPPIWAAYFYEVGCQECSRAEYDIRYAQSKYPQLQVKEYSAQEDAALAEWLGARAGVPQKQRLATPAFFIGDDYLIGADITPEAVLALVEKYAQTGVERVWADFNPEEGGQSIIERFKSFGVLTVAFAGLVDGLNPCAFATLAFFSFHLGRVPGLPDGRVWLLQGVGSSRGPADDLWTLGVWPDRPLVRLTGSI
jgi:thiol-disulfide isomerase/thioredoxin